MDKVLGKAVDSAASKVTGGLIKEVPTEAKSIGVDYLKKNPETAVTWLRRVSLYSALAS